MNANSANNKFSVHTSASNSFVEQKQFAKMVIDYYERNERKIEKIQALWRGYSERKIVEFVKINEKFNSKYFVQAEFKETLSKSTLSEELTIFREIHLQVSKGS